MANHPGMLIREATPFHDASYEYTPEEAEEMLSRINAPQSGLLGNEGQSEIAILRDVCSMLIERVQVLESRAPAQPEAPDPADFIWS